MYSPLDTTYNRGYGYRFTDTIEDMVIALLIFLLQELTRRIFPLCEDYVLVSQFVESRSHFKNGLVNHALAAALRAFLLVQQLSR